MDGVLGYADDHVCIEKAASEDKLEKKTNRMILKLEKTAKKLNLFFNAAKTKYMIITGKVRKRVIKLKLNERRIEEVRSFK